MPIVLTLALLALVLAPSSPTAAVPGARAPVVAAAARAPVVVATDARPWGFTGSDIPLNPRVTFGTLENGLRFAWMANPEPDSRTHLRLHVDVGSLAERDDELGLAHFLEHMAFNGSRHFAPGELVAWFQAQGMAFGADTNAHTSFGETVYAIDLPRSDAASLDEALLVLRDFADGLLLQPEEIAAELGVVDAEERERDSAQRRLQERMLEHLFAGTRVPERLPIGDAATRATFDEGLVRAFYERWYRPDTMTLLVVGDLGDLDPTPLIEARFSSMDAPQAPRPSEPDVGEPDVAPRAFAVHDPELPTARISISRLRAYEPPPPTRAEVVADLPLQAARAMLNLRFDELAREPETPALAVRMGAGGGLDVLEGETLSIVCAPERWQDAVAFAEQQARRAIEHGFDPAELEEVRANVLRSLDEAVEREPTRSSASWIAELLAAAESPLVPTTARTHREIFAPAITALDVDRARAALADAWGDGALVVAFAGPIEVDPDAVLAAYERSTEVDVAPRAALDVGAFAYGSSPDRVGELLARAHVEDLDVHQVAFTNGVRLNVKRTDFRQRQILVHARVGEGRLSLPPERQELRLAAELGFVSGGLGAHDADALRRLTAGRLADVEFGVSDDHFAMHGATTAEDLVLQCELMAAYLTDAGWRPDGLVDLPELVDAVHDGYRHQFAGPLALRFVPALHGGDPRFTIAAREVQAAVTIDDVRAWLEPELARAPVEVSIVGDVPVDAAIEAVARTFGTLAARRDRRAWNERREVTIASAVRMEDTIESEVPSALVYVSFHTTDGLDARVRRELQLLSRVLADRLRVHVREELGAAYAPAASSEASLVYPGLGRLDVAANAAPEDADAMLELLLAQIATLADDGITEDEVARQREPLLETLRERMRNNGFWLGLLSDSQSRPGALDDVRRLEADYRAVDAAALEALARRFLDPEAASWIVVRPVPPGD